jgi:hypothetical protein
MHCRRDDLAEYWSHMAHHLSKDIWAAETMENLADDKAVITSDYKMKSMSCFFVRTRRNGLEREELHYLVL